MLEAAHKSPRPFATAAAGKEYFGSETHYRVLAGRIRDQLQEHGGCVLLTGTTAPNSELLRRHLAVVGPPRCRATVIRCHAQMTITGLLDNYRRLVGGTVEAVTRRVASWSGATTPSSHGEEIDVLILEDAENLADEVLEHLCRPAKDTQVHWPPRLLVAGETILERLAAPSLKAASETLTGHFELNRLAHREVGPFIRYQLMAADLDGLELFRPQIVELIETYADGDPIVVNGLARRVLRIVPSLTKLFRVPEADLEQETGSTEEQGTDDGAAVATALGKPSAAVAVGPIADLEQTPRTSAPPENASPAIPVEPSMAALVPVPLNEPAPVEASRTTEVSLAAAHAAAEVAAPTIEPMEAPANAAKVAAPIAEATVPAPVIEVPFDAPVVEARLDPSSAAKIAEPTADVAIPAPAADAPFDAPVVAGAEQLAESSERVAAAPESDFAPSKEGERAAVPSAEELPIVPAPAPGSVVLEQDSPPKTVPPKETPRALESAAVAVPATKGPIDELPPVLSFSADTVPPAPANDEDAPAAAAARPRIRSAHLRNVAAFSVAAASVIVAFTGTIVLTEHRGGRESYLDAAVGFIKSMILAEAPSRSIGASEPVPQDLGKQSLRTASDAEQSLLTSAEPTGVTRPATGAPVAEPVVAPLTNAPSRSSPPEAASAAPAPAAKVTPAAPLPPAGPSQASGAEPVPPVALGPRATTPAAPSTATPVTPPKREGTAAAPPAEPRVVNPARSLASGDIDQLLRRGDQLLAGGDIIAARHYFELITEAGDMRAALRLGQTYDPTFLQQSGVRGIVGNPAVAKSWYLKAIAAGDKEADMRLLQLMTLYPQ